MVRTERKRKDWQRKPCESCGGPKPPGRGVHRCNECAHNPLDTRTLDELIADQAKEMKMGRRVHRQRFGDISRVRARTLSLDALDAELWVNREH